MSKFYIRMFFLFRGYCSEQCLLCLTLHETATNKMTTFEYTERLLIGTWLVTIPTERWNVHISLSIHLPLPYNTHSMEKSMERKQCVQCTKMEIKNTSNNVCKTCDVHLCYSFSRNSFSVFHAGCNLWIDLFVYY